MKRRKQSYVRKMSKCNRKVKKKVFTESKKYDKIKKRVYFGTIK